MPGVIVGVDGSGHSQRALEFAMKEAALRHAPLTVLTVHEAIRGYFGGVSSFPDDAELTEKARAAVQEEADKVLAGLGESRPESVTVEAVHGFPVEELSLRQRQASSNRPISAYVAAKVDKHNGSVTVAPVERDAVSPEAIIEDPANASPLRAKTQPRCIIPFAFHCKASFSSATAISSSRSDFAVW